MKKIFWAFFLLSIVLISIPVLSDAAGLVPCSGPDCTICSFFQMLVNIYDFIVKDIATPLAVLAITIGAIFILVSAGNPATLTKGKDIIKWSIIGVVLVWCSFLIINFVLTTIGYKQNWSDPQLNCGGSGVFDENSGGGGDF